MWNITIIFKKDGINDSRNFTFQSKTKPTHEEIVEAIKINSAIYAIVEEVV